VILAILVLQEQVKQDLQATLGLPAIPVIPVIPDLLVPATLG
jgi:hypothetical protein